jgi:hypothetical protein
MGCAIKIFIRYKMPLSVYQPIYSVYNAAVTLRLQFI